MGETVSAAKVKQDFGFYQNRARQAPVVVTKSGRPCVVILAAEEYDRLRRLEREALAVTELTQSEVEAIAAARVPEEHRYRSDDVP